MLCSCKYVLGKTLSIYPVVLYILEYASNDDDVIKHIQHIVKLNFILVSVRTFSVIQTSIFIVSRVTYKLQSLLQTSLSP